MLSKEQVKAVTNSAMVNFIHAKMELDSFSKSTVGRQLLFYAELLIDENRQVLINGKPISKVFANEDPGSSGKLRARIGVLKKRVPRIWGFLREIRQFSSLEEIPEQFFVHDALNVVFQTPFLKSNYFWRNYNVRLIFDEPPEVGVNVENYLIWAGLRSRLKRTVQRSGGVWCYHEASKKYVSAMQPMVRVDILPCSMRKDIPDFTDDSLGSKFSSEEGHGLNIAIVSSFMPWHHVYEFVAEFVKLDLGVLHLIGDGLTRFDCERLAKGSKRIIFHGFLSEAEIDAIMINCHMGVLPGIPWFNAPLKIIDYGAAVCACLSIESPGIRSIYDDNEVIFCDSISEIIESIRRFSDDPEELLQWALALHQKVQTDFHRRSYGSRLSNMLT